MTMACRQAMSETGSVVLLLKNSVGLYEDGDYEKIDEQENPKNVSSNFSVEKNEKEQYQCHLTERHG